MKTLNFKSLLSIVLFSVLTLASCSKNKDIEGPVSPAVGKWEGTYNGSVYFFFDIKKDGSLTMAANMSKDAGKGTWSFDGSVVTIIYYYDAAPEEKYLVKAKMNDAHTELSGSWGYGTETANDGDVYLVKK